MVWPMKIIPAASLLFSAKYCASTEKKKNWLFTHEKKYSVNTIHIGRPFKSRRQLAIHRRLKSVSSPVKNYLKNIYIYIYILKLFFTRLRFVQICNKNLLLLTFRDSLPPSFLHRGKGARPPRPLVVSYFPRSRPLPVADTGGGVGVITPTPPLCVFNFVKILWKFCVFKYLVIFRRQGRSPPITPPPLWPSPPTPLQKILYPRLPTSKTFEGPVNRGLLHVGAAGIDVSSS